MGSAVGLLLHPRRTHGGGGGRQYDQEDDQEEEEDDGDGEWGLIPRVLRKVFASASSPSFSSSSAAHQGASSASAAAAAALVKEGKRQEGSRVTNLRLGFVEIYNEEIRLVSQSVNQSMSQ
jgi:hypothetical protein